MRRLPVLFLIALTAAALGYADPFLPGLTLGAGPDEIRDAMAETGWTVENIKVSPGGHTILRSGNSSGWLLHYEYAPDGSPVSIITAEAWPDEGQRAGSHDAWKERLSAQFGEPELVSGTYGDLLRWSVEGCTVELDMTAPEFYVEGWFSLVVLVLFGAAGV